MIFKDGTSSWLTQFVVVLVVLRPAATHALHYDKLPDRLVTVFAGQDKEATQQARDYFEGYAPSSPSL